MVNLLGTGPAREAHLDSLGLARAMADPTCHLHLYDKRQVFERRKMGHVTTMLGAGATLAAIGVAASIVPAIAATHIRPRARCDRTESAAP